MNTLVLTETCVPSIQALATTSSESSLYLGVQRAWDLLQQTREKETGYLFWHAIGLALTTTQENSLNYNWKVELLNLSPVIYSGEGVVSGGFC